MSARCGGKRRGFATARHTRLAFGIAVAIWSLAGSAPVAGQGGDNNAAGRRPPGVVVKEAPRPWPPARLPDGQPNLQGGLWRAEGGGGTNTLLEGGGGKSRIADPAPDGHAPMQPWARALQLKQEVMFLGGDYFTQPYEIDTQHRCLNVMPRLHYFAEFRITQAPGKLVFSWDGYHQWRVIRMDGSPHIAPSFKLWRGDSVGRWEGLTLVIDTTNHNGKNRLDRIGHFFTKQTRLTERITFLDPNKMDYQVTIDDPTVFTRPWTIRVPIARSLDEEIWEYACHEGNSTDDRPDLDQRILGLPPAKIPGWRPW